MRTSTPTDVAIDDDKGALYIADENNHRIQKVVLTDRTIATVVGARHTCGAAGYTVDGALSSTVTLAVPHSVAYDAEGGVLYIAESNNDSIRRARLGPGGTIDTVAGNPSSQGELDPATSTKTALLCAGVVSIDASEPGHLLVASAYAVYRVRIANDAIDHLAGVTVPSGSFRTEKTLPPIDGQFPRLWRSRANGKRHLGLDDLLSRRFRGVGHGVVAGLVDVVDDEHSIAQ